MRLTTLFFVLGMAACNMAAQVKIAYGLESPGFLYAPVSTDKGEVKDSAYLTLTYSYCYRASENDDSLSNEDLIDLLIGNDYNECFSRNLRQSDIDNTEQMKSTMEFAPAESYYAGWDILVSHAEENQVVTNRLPYSEEVVEYVEGIPQLAYSVTEETDTVMGYLCKKAICNYGGREWKVWFTEDIPLPYGPWKLNGAEGLILKAADSGNNFVFEAVGLTQTPRAIVAYPWKRKRMTPAEWREYERDLHKNAGAFVRSTGARILVMDDSERGFHRLKEDWEQYFNPLERE